jgi:hypothetical protein
LAVAGLFAIRVSVLTAAGQPAGALVVKVRITGPTTLGVNVEVNEVGSEKLPLGAVQRELVAPPPILPAKVKLPPKQTAGCGNPAFAVGAAVTVTVNGTAALGHPAAPFLTVIVPL